MNRFTKNNPQKWMHFRPFICNRLWLLEESSCGHGLGNSRQHFFRHKKTWFHDRIINCSHSNHLLKQTFVSKRLKGVTFANWCRNSLSIYTTTKHAHTHACTVAHTCLQIHGGGSFCILLSSHTHTHTHMVTCHALTCIIFKTSCETSWVRVKFLALWERERGVERICPLLLEAFCTSELYNFTIKLI